MNYILFDSFRRSSLLPLTYIRPVADIRIGILTIREKWEKYLEAETSTLTEDYLGEKYPIREEDDNVMINGSICPNPTLVKKIQALKNNEVLVKDESIIAMRVEKTDLENTDEDNIQGVNVIETDNDFLKIDHTWEIFSKNDRALREDFMLLTKNRKSKKLSSSNRVMGDMVFVEEGAKVEGVSINSTTGPVYIGRDAEIMEGSMIRGPFALCNNAIVKMSAKIYGATTIGPYSKVGGEISNSVIFGYSNKVHDGFMGNSVIGEWCNLGADTNTSNLKNNYESVKLWDFPDQTFVDTGEQFCGLIMGDHSKCGINTMFNTGTVVGINVNVFGSGYQRNFIPSFTWGGTSGFRTFDIKKAIQVAKIVFARRGLDFDETEINILNALFNMTLDNRESKIYI